MEPVAVDTPSGGRPTAPAAAPAPMGKVRRTLREVGLAMVTGGVVVLAFVTYQLWGTSFHEKHAQNTLRNSFNAAVAHHTGTSASGSSGTSTGTTKAAGGKDNPTLGSGGASLSPSTPTGVAVDHLVIPAIGVNKYVVQGTGASQLSEGPGHYVNTPFPGQRGNAAIAGHRTTYGAPFFRLNNLKTGERIYVTNTLNQVFVFKVAKVLVVAPNDVKVLDTATHAELTLTTCNPPFSATSRLVVVSDLVGRPSASPPTTATASAPSKTTGKAGATATTTTTPTTPATSVAADNLGSGNSNGWPPAIAYGAAFLVLWIGVRIAINRTRRWARLAAFVVGIGVCAVPLWFCFENVVRLLPANI